jgi:hypothetical protein
MGEVATASSLRGSEGSWCVLLVPVLVASLLLETVVGPVWTVDEVESTLELASGLFETVVGPVWTVELEVALVLTSRTGATAVSFRVLGAAV